MFYQINSIHGIVDTLEYFMKVWLNIEKCSILTYFGNKIILKNEKKNAPARTIKFSKKDDKFMMFFKAP